MSKNISGKLRAVFYKRKVKNNNVELWSDPVAPVWMAKQNQANLFKKRCKNIYNEVYVRRNGLNCVIRDLCNVT